MYNRYLIIIFFFAFYYHSLAQTTGGSEPEYPEVGKRVEITLNDMHYYPKQQVSLNDFSGKWLVLDFWHRWCSGCIESFSETDSLQKLFSNKVQFLLVGYTGSQYSHQSDNKAIRELFEKLRVKLNLKLAIAYDSVLFKRFDIYGCPYILIIDPSGIVRGITYSLNAENINDFLAGKEPRLPKAWRRDENNYSYDANAPFLIKNNGGNDTDYLYRSILSEFKDYMPSDNDFRFEIRENKLQVLGVDLASLYRFAYVGVSRLQVQDSLYEIFYPLPILEINDSSLFKVNRDLRKNLYCYSLSVPPSKANKKEIMIMMQRDLLNYFGYSVNIEFRKMPIWKLISLTKPIIHKETNNGVTSSHEYSSVKRLLWDIAIYNSSEDQFPFIDETGVSSQIHLKLNCNLSDLDDIKRALQNNGLDLVKGEKEMRVLIIKDKKLESTW